MASWVMYFIGGNRVKVSLSQILSCCCLSLSVCLFVCNQSQDTMHVRSVHGFVHMRETGHNCGQSVCYNTQMFT